MRERNHLAHRNVMKLKSFGCSFFFPGCTVCHGSVVCACLFPKEILPPPTHAHTHTLPVACTSSQVGVGKGCEVH